MIFRRQIEKLIGPWIREKEIIVITGMRRVGKTTLLRKIFESIESENKVFLDFENMLDRMIFREDDFNNILKNLDSYDVSVKSQMYIFIDEIQYRPETVKAVKYLYDHYSVKFFISGSSSFYLKNMFPESLAGRKIVFELYPLTFSEYLVFKGIRRDEHDSFSEKSKFKNKISYEKLKKEYDEYMYFGGFPQVVLKKSEDLKKELLNDIFRSYYQKRSGAEVDFILPEKQLAIEVKNTGTEVQLKKLRQIADSLKLKESYIISKNYKTSEGFIPATDL